MASGKYGRQVKLALIAQNEFQAYLMRAIYLKYLADGPHLVWH